MIENHNISINVQAKSQRARSEKSKGVALALCILMGIFGGHLFYVGRGQKAVIYILTFGLMGIGVFIDLLLILSNSFEDAYEMKLTRW